jgi:hypothetical protein
LNYKVLSGEEAVKSVVRGLNLAKQIDRSAAQHPHDQCDRKKQENAKTSREDES